LERFKVVFAKVAVKDLNRLEPRTRFRILDAIKELEVFPFPKGGNIKKLKGASIPIYRLRVGDSRIVYHINKREVVVLFIVGRKDLEKKLKTLR